LRVRIQKALAIDYLGNEMRMLGAASVGPIDMGTQVMSVARVGLPHFCTKRTSANLLRLCGRVAYVSAHADGTEARKRSFREGPLRKVYRGDKTAIEPFIAGCGVGTPTCRDTAALAGTDSVRP